MKSGRVILPNLIYISVFVDTCKIYNTYMVGKILNSVRSCLSIQLINFSLNSEPYPKEFSKQSRPTFEDS